MADRVALMRDGRLVQVDTPEGIYLRPASLFVARFFCELNEIGGTVRGGMAETAVGRFAAPGLAEGQAAIVGIRPQAIRLRSAGEGVPARLQRRQFIGHVDLMEIAVEGLEQPLKGRILRDAVPPVNTDIGVTFDPAEVLVFAASEA
jgi:iron(III) transport system ATP-binding protein